MGKMTWEKLITVNYKGGLSGDFFSNLLADNFDNLNIEYEKTKKEQHKYSFHNRDVFEQKFKSFADFLDYREGDLPAIHNSFKPLKDYPTYKIFHEMFKHETLEDSFKEIAELFYSLFSYKFSDGKYKVTNFHNLRKDAPSLQAIFPGSKNIVLVCDYSYFPLSRILFYYKNLINDYDKIVKIKKETFDEFINSSFFIEPNYYRYDEHPVNIYQLIFCDKKYDEELSEFLQTPIKLNKKKILKYRKDHIELFKKFNVDPYKSYSKEEIYGLIVDFVRTDERFRFD